MTSAGPQQLALQFSSGGQTLIGVLHRPAADAPSAHRRTGVVLVVGGPQYRVGSHRQFVLLARALALAGHPVLRFDSQGMGDSSGDLRGFQELTGDIGAAVDALHMHVPDVCRVALWGLCDGASAALLYLFDRPDPRVCGLCLLNPWVRSPTSLARTHVKHYYTRRIREREFWVKLLKGGVAVRALRDLVENVKRTRAPGVRKGADKPFQQRMADALSRQALPTLFVLSGNDYTAKEFLEFTSQDAQWAALVARARRCDLPGADHTFSTQADRQAVEEATCHWLAELATRAEQAPAAHR